ncbi:unnamed protein product [Chironomus riparius]|uniref:RING-CH-type domain-containing protein n=1 Tax=Chironomus riparius TaxID=315576 RepID=A0A9N9WNE0_9DIPT|nr:unnamed protein product [Chironomus riparius]
MSASLSISSISSKNDNSFCRICYSFSSYDLIRVPCNCKNSIGYVHRNCLRRWIRAINNSFCEICQTEYTRNIVFPQRRSLQDMLLTFIDEPLTAILRFATNLLCVTGIGYFIVRKLFIIYEPFENEMVDAGDITINSFQREYQFLSIAVLITGFLSYIHLAKLTVVSFRELLSTLHNWWDRGRFTFSLSNAYVDDNNNNDDDVD